MSTDLNQCLTLNGEPLPQEAQQGTGEPTKHSRYRPLLRLILRYPIWTFVLVVGVPGAILSSSWRVLDQRFPKLNDFIHANVSSQDDVDYQLYKLKESKDAYNKGLAACDDANASFDACRSAILSSESALMDMSSREQKLAGAWQKESADNSMPSICRQSGNDTYEAWGDYLSQEKRVMTLVRTVDSKSKASVADFSAKLSLVTPAEDAAVKRINNLPPWPKECANY